LKTKRPSLAETMQQIARPEPSAKRPTPTPAPAATARPSGFYAATRVGRKKLTAALDPAAHTQFRQLALEVGRNGEALMVEAINDLFTKYRKPPIA
jgi:hypothetical protein